MLMRVITVSISGVFQLRPGPATRANFPRRCTMATCEVCTVKNEPKTTLKTKITTTKPKNRSTPDVASMVALLFREDSGSLHEFQPLTQASGVNRLDEPGI